MLDGLIIGGGISGLSVAHWLGLRQHPETWELWEAEQHPGGTIGTDRDHGYSIDWGPNGFLDREPLTLRMVEEIGLNSALEPANKEAENRFIVKGGRLHAVPLSPPAMLRTPLLGFADKLRIFMEPFISARRGDDDESVFDFAARRIGRSAAEMFVDPMVSGIYGGIANKLSLPACFPIMREMEKTHGGLVRALIAKKRERGKSAAAGTTTTRQGGPAGPAGRLTSFRTGLDVLVKCLARRFEPILRTGRRLSVITRKDQGWEVTSDQGHRLLCRHLVLACPTFAVGDLVRTFDPALAAVFQSIPYAPIVVIGTGHRREDIRYPLNGFGFIIPRNQGLRTLGSIWTSSIFSNRAPDGFVQFRTMLGGAGDPAIMELTDDQLWGVVRGELGPIVGIGADPAFVRIYRWEKGIPQYTLGHLERRACIENLLSRHPNLHVVGNAYRGIGLNDCVKMAYHVAQKIRTAPPPGAGITNDE